MLNYSKIFKIDLLVNQVRKGYTEGRILHAGVPVAETLVEKLATAPGQAAGVQGERDATQNSSNWLGRMEQVEEDLLEAGAVP